MLLIIEDVLSLFRPTDVECPGFLIAGFYLIAEGGPLQLEFLLGQRLDDLVAQCVADTVLHPREVEFQLVAVFFLIVEFIGFHEVAHVERSFLNNVVSADEGVEDMDILVGRSHLHIHGSAIARELVGRSPKPLLGFCGRMLVGKVEDHEFLRNRVGATVGHKLVFARLQRGEWRWEVGCLVGHGRERMVDALHVVDHLAAHFLAGHIDKIEGDVLQIVFPYTVRQVYREQSLFSAHGYGCDALLRLTRWTGYVCCHVEAEDAVRRYLCVVLVLQDEGDAHREITLVVGDARVCSDKRSVVAVAPPAPPHPSTLDGVFHQGAHHRHSGKGARVALHGHGVASLVGLGEFV